MFSVLLKYRDVVGIDACSSSLRLTSSIVFIWMEQSRVIFDWTTRLLAWIDDQFVVGTDETGPVTELEAQMRPLIHHSWYCIQSGNNRPLPARLDLHLHGGLRAGAGLGALLAGCLGVNVPRPIPVGAVASGPLIDGYAFARWDDPVSRETVGTYSRQRSAAITASMSTALWPVSCRFVFTADICSECEGRSILGMTPHQSST